MPGEGLGKQRQERRDAEGRKDDRGSWELEEFADQWLYGVGLAGTICTRGDGETQIGSLWLTSTPDELQGTQSRAVEGSGELASYIGGVPQLKLMSNRGKKEE